MNFSKICNGLIITELKVEPKLKDREINVHKLNYLYFVSLLF